MHRRFEDLLQRDDRSQVRAFVQRANLDELAEIVRDGICKPAAAKIFGDLLQALDDSDACQQKRRKLTELGLKMLGESKISIGQANAIVNRVILDLPRYSKQHLVKFVDFCLASIRQGDSELPSWEDLLPVLLETLENEKYIVHVDAEVSGSEYKSLIVKDICSCRWNIDLLPSLTKMFGEIPLGKTDRDEVLKALSGALPDLPLDRMPSFVYQALKLCKDKDSHKLLHALSVYFRRRYAQAASASDENGIEGIAAIDVNEVRDVESTVLYHIYQAARLNHESTRDFVRFLKQVSHTFEYILQPFMLAALMSLSSVYEDQVFEIPKMAVVNRNIEMEKQESSAWLRKLSPASPDIGGIVQRVIDSSNRDRHLVLKGLTSFAFVLMSVDRKAKGDARKMWRIGLEIVQDIIKKCHETVPIVLQEVVNKIVAEGAPTHHYIECLSYACRKLSMIVLDHQTWIMVLLERLLYLSSAAADRVLRATLPLMRVSPNIRENLLLTLRKALYRKGVSKRRLAVTGFLEMLKYSSAHSPSGIGFGQRATLSARTITSSSSCGSTLTQATLESNSQRERLAPRCDKTLSLEILDILKKSFTYEYEVKLHLYEGLSEAVMKNSETTELVLDMLVSHFNLYFCADDTVLPPVKFELCTDTRGVDAVPTEPLGQLVFLLQTIYIRTCEKNSSILDKLHDTLESLCRRMAAMELEHLNLELGANSSHGDPVKFRIKILNLDIAVAIYEALMAYRIGECSRRKSGSVHGILDLFQAYTRMGDFIEMQTVKAKRTEAGKSKKDRDANTSSRKKFAKMASAAKTSSTVMNLEVVRDALSLLYSQPRSTQNEYGPLRESRSFSRYVLRTCEQLLPRMKLPADDGKGCIDEGIEIARTLYRYFLVDLKHALTNDKEAAITAVLCFKEISCCVCGSLASELPRFLDSLIPRAKADTNTQLEEIVYSAIAYLGAPFIEEADGDEAKTLPSLLLQIAEQFAFQIRVESYDWKEMLVRVKRTIQLEHVHPSVIPGMVRFYLNLEERAQEYGETLNEMCLELCEKVGSIDGTEIVTAGQYKVVREDTAGHVYSALNGHAKEKLSNASWLLMRLKAEDAISRASGTIDESWSNELREKERNLCKQLSQLAQVLLTLANTSVKSGSLTDNTFKNLQDLYHLLGGLTKYFYGKSSGQRAAFQAVKFIQVVQLAGKPLKSAFYNLVTYVEENQNKVDSKSDSYARRNKILRETKVIPRVVYEIEQFNKEALLLGKRTGVPLENYMKHSVTRDFRIKNPQLVEGLEKMDASMVMRNGSEQSRPRLFFLESKYKKSDRRKASAIFLARFLVARRRGH